MLRFDVGKVTKTANERNVEMKKIGMIGLSIVLASSLVVMAEQGGGGQGGAAKAKGAKVEAFAKADANADGKLSLEEFKTMVTKGDAEAKFTAADTDKDGFLTKAELKAAHGKKGEKKAVVAPAVPAANEAPAAPAAQ